MWEGERRQVMRLPHSGHCYTIGLRPTHTCVYVCVLAEQWPLGRVSWMINSVFFCLSFVPSFFVFIYLYIYLSNHLDPKSTPYPLAPSANTYKHTNTRRVLHICTRCILNMLCVSNTDFRQPGKVWCCKQKYMEKAWLTEPVFLTFAIRKCLCAYIDQSSLYFWYK